MRKHKILNMKKIIIATCLLISQLSIAQKEFSKGNNYASISYGLGTIGMNFTSIYSSLPNYKSSTLGPIGGYYERAVTDNIGAGISINYLRNSASYDMIGTAIDMTISQLAVAVRGAYHFKLSNKKLDPYAGAGLAYRNFSYKSNISSINFSFGSPVGIQAYAGSRFFFTDNLAAFAEVGYGVSFLNIGATFKF